MSCFLCMYFLGSHALIYQEWAGEAGLFRFEGAFVPAPIARVSQYCFCVFPPSFYVLCTCIFISCVCLLRVRVPGPAAGPTVQMEFILAVPFPSAAHAGCHFSLEAVLGSTVAVLWDSLPIFFEKDVCGCVWRHMASKSAPQNYNFGYAP